jgi:sortase A
VICAGWWTTVTVHGWYFRSQQVSRFDQLAKAGAADALPLPGVPVAISSKWLPQVKPGGLVGILDVPRLRISTPVISGDDEKALDVAGGHLPDTRLPWEPGNSSVAAHRDGLFRPLRNVRRGDLVRMRTVHGDFDYVVREMKIVEPDDLSVLANGAADSLTLITCYPFSYIGHAPKRFIVRAERRGAAPDASAIRTVAGLTPLRPGVEAARPLTRPAHAVSARRVPPTAGRRVRAERGPAVRAKSGVPKERSVSQRDRRERETAARPAAKASKASRDAQRGKDQPKKRRWYYLFIR